MAENVPHDKLMKVLDGLDLLAEGAGLVLADGKIDLNDLPALMLILPKVQILIDAVRGMGEAAAQAKDIREDEAVEIVRKLYAIGAKLEKK